MSTIKWGIAGPGTIADKFALAIADVNDAELTAIGSLNADRANSFGEKHNVAKSNRFSDYESLVNCSDIDAVYIANLHPSHAATATLAMQAGKHVLCEKPAGMNAKEVIAMTETAKQHNVMFMEAFMYLCHPQMIRVTDIINSGELGRVEHIDASFGFYEKPDLTSRLFALELGGGGILDVGCYPVSFSRRIAGLASGNGFDEPSSVAGNGKLFSTGVDEFAQAELQFASGITASCRCAITQELPNTAVVTLEKGKITIPTPWLPGDGNKPADATINISTGTSERTEPIASPSHHYSYEIAHACATIRERRIEPTPPGMSHAGSIGNAKVLDEWLRLVGYKQAAV